MKGTNHPWGKDIKCAGKDWFSALKRNGDIALRKKEGLSENYKPTGPPVVQSTADLNEAGPPADSQAKHKTEETNVC
jgi:hypothetical protein